MQDQTIASHLTPRSAVDFSDPKLLAQIWEFGAGHLCSYLIALAAVQRGLDVTFYGSSLDSRSAGRSQALKSTRPRLFTVSGGNRSFFFDQSFGSLTGQKVSALSAHKGATKAKFIQAGVPTPNGMLADEKTLRQLVQFLSLSSATQFIIKPHDGSLGKGVEVNLGRHEVLDGVRRAGKRLTLVEEQIVGREYRVYVVNGRIAAAYEKPGCFVIGNGKSTIAQLIAERNRKRTFNPYLAKSPIDPTRVTDYLSRAGILMTKVPVFGERVDLNHAKNISSGGIPRDCSETLSEKVVKAAIAACHAIDMLNAGVDIIEDESGPFVLELNVRAHIGGHSFPFEGKGVGNAVAEAIIDHYFPADGIRRDTTRIIDAAHLNAAFSKDGDKTVCPVRLLE